MEETNIPDYKLDGFLKNFFLEQLRNPSGDDLTVRLPAIVQVVNVQQEIGDWSSYKFIDNKFKMVNCAFVSKQTMPECFSILKINKISKLSMDVSNYIDQSEWYNISTVLGEIEFDIEVSGEQIGNSLFWGNKHIDMAELKERKKVLGLWNLKKVLEATNPSERMLRSMWENRSEKFCSVKFTFKDDQGVIVYAHKSVLVQISEVFKANFDNEAFSDTNAVLLVDINFYYFNKFLEFIYTGKVQFTSREVAFELLYLGKKYLMSPLEELCRDVISQFLDNSQNLLKALNLNKKPNDEIIHREIKSNIESSLIRVVVNCEDFLDCDFSTIEWILSSDHLDIDEWSLLCAVYKWACHNGIAGFCHNEEDQMHDSMNCLHGILECIHFEMIDMISLLRFFKLPKLPEIVDVDKLKMSIFDSLQEDGSYFDNLDVGTNCYSKRRIGYTVYTEIPIGNHGLQETRMKNIRLDEGPVLGFKVKVEKKGNSLDISLSFQYLYTTDDEEATEDFRISVTLIQKAQPLHIVSPDIFWMDQLEKGEWKKFNLNLKDCQSYLSTKIEDFGIENSDGSEKDKILALELGLCYNP